jgi:hypothetical protein
MGSIHKTTRQLAGVLCLFGLAFFSCESIASECSINGFDPTSKNRLTLRWNLADLKVTSPHVAATLILVNHLAPARSLTPLNKSHIRVDQLTVYTCLACYVSKQSKKKVSQALTSTLPTGHSPLKDLQKDDWWTVSLWVQNPLENK